MIRMNNKEIIDLAAQYLTPNYNRQPVALLKGKGAAVWDADGKKYLDFVSGLAVTGLGHSNAGLNKAIARQLSLLTHTSNLYYTEPQALFARDLMAFMPRKGRIFFCNSGTEANEAALKLARKFSIEKFAKDRFEIIAFTGGFHGRSMGSLSMTADAKYRDGFGPLLPGVKHVPYGDADAAAKAVTKKTCAIIVEPLQGENGVQTPKAGFIQKLARLCAEKKLLLIFDEVQTGFGRTGKMFAFEHFNVKPDIVTMAKGIAGGLPMGAMYARDDVAALLTPGSHAATFGGNPAVCAAALATFEELKKPGFLENVAEMGRYLLLKLTSLKTSIPAIREVRGMGLMVGLELIFPCAPAVEKCRELGLLINCAQEKTLRFLPPLTITKAEVDRAVGIVTKALGGR